MGVKKTIAIIVAAIFVFAMAAVSLAAEEKTEMVKPAGNTSPEAPKATAPEIEKLKKPGELKEQEKQQFKELTPEEEQRQLKEFEEQEKQHFKELKDWE
jgi:Spy/CpxP family protein refolding chaperone